MSTIPDKKKLIIKIATIVVAILLVAVWVFLAVITLNSVRYAGRYDEDEGTRYIAHRGYSSAYFQNTYQSFAAAAWSDFFQGIETDVWRTKDGVYVCSHDNNPFADKNILITESNFADIANLPLDLSLIAETADRTKNYRICKLEEYLMLCRGYQKTAFIEIKHDFTEEEAIEFARYVFGKISYSRVYFCSFNKDVIDHIYSEYRYANIELFTASSAKAYFYQKCGYNVVVNKNALSKNSVKRAHKKGLFIGAYTVNDIDEAERLAEMGVDWITTDTVLG